MPNRVHPPGARRSTLGRERSLSRYQTNNRILYLYSHVIYTRRRARPRPHFEAVKLLKRMNIYIKSIGSYFCKH